MTVQVHILGEGENPDDHTFVRLCPTRGNAVTTTADHTDLLPNGDGFDLHMYDPAHHLIFYRDVCPIDAHVTALIAALPGMQASIPVTGLTGYQLVNAIWTGLFTKAGTWLDTRFGQAGVNLHSYIQNILLPQILLQWMACPGSGTLITLV